MYPEIKLHCNFRSGALVLKATCAPSANDWHKHALEHVHLPETTLAIRISKPTMNPALGLGVLRQRCAAAGLGRIAIASPGAVRQRRSYATKQPGAAAQFYKTFTRPIGKVLVLAVFTYQVAYWTWTKLEADEHRAETDATIAALENTVNEYKKTKDGRKDAS